MPFGAAHTYIAHIREYPPPTGRLLYVCSVTDHIRRQKVEFKVAAVTVKRFIGRTNFIHFTQLHLFELFFPPKYLLVIAKTYLITGVCLELLSRANQLVVY